MQTGFGCTKYRFLTVISPYLIHPVGEETYSPDFWPTVVAASIIKAFMNDKHGNKSNLSYGLIT